MSVIIIRYASLLISCNKSFMSQKYLYSNVLHLSTSRPQNKEEIDSVIQYDVTSSAQKLQMCLALISNARKELRICLANFSTREMLLYLYLTYNLAYNAS